MKRCSLLFSALYLMANLGVCVAETVYKSTHAQGVPEFSDLPTPNSQTIEVQPAQTYSPPDYSKILNAVDAKIDKESVHYQISITQPENEHNFTTDTHSFPVSVSVEPALKKGDKIQLLLNGQPTGPLYSSTQMTVNPPERLPRGSYQLQARVVSEADPKIIKGESSTITFYQFRKTILAP